MNSTVRLTFYESFSEKRSLWVCEQYMRPTKHFSVYFAIKEVVGPVYNVRDPLTDKTHVIGKRGGNAGHAKRYPNVHFDAIWIRLIYVCILLFHVSSFFFFNTRSWFHVGDRPASGSRVLCMRPISTLDVHTLF